MQEDRTVHGLKKKEFSFVQTDKNDMLLYTLAYLLAMLDVVWQGSTL